MTLWLLSVGFFTLAPQPTPPGPNPTWGFFCVACGSRGIADAVLNVVLFLPLGVLLPQRRHGLLRVVTVALVLSSSIELVQLLIPGRDSSLGDILTNTGGAWMGAAVWALRARWLSGPGTRLTALRAVSVGMVFLVTLGFGWLMRPNWPMARYWGQWTPDLGSMEHYRGQVLRARLDSIPIPSSRLPDTRVVRRALRGAWTITASVVKGPTPRELAPILSIYDERQREILLLGADHDDLVYRERSRSQRFKLDEPVLRFRGILTQAAVGDTVELGVVRQRGRRCLELDGMRDCPFFTPGRAWAVLYTVDSTDPWLPRGLDVLWMLLLLFPVGFWSERRRNLWVSGVASGVLLGVAVELTRLGPPPLSEVVGAVAGLLMGYATRVAVATLEEQEIQDPAADPRGRR